MGKPRTTLFSAEEEIAQRQKYREAMQAAGWRQTNESLASRRFPFTARRKVVKLVFGKEVWRPILFAPHVRCVGTLTVDLYVPAANSEYESTFLNRLKAANDRTLSAHGLTDDADANAALEMSL